MLLLIFLYPCTLYVNKIKHFIQAKMSFNKNYPWNGKNKTRKIQKAKRKTKSS